MVTGRRTAAASISERSRRSLRILFVLALATIGILSVEPARASSDVLVLEDGTPLVSKPGVGGKILLWVDTGFPLTVVGREGDWLKVSSSQLKSGSGALWVPAARVGRHLPGTVDITYSQDEPSTAPEGEALFLEVVGSQDIRVRAHCRIAQPGKDDFIDVVDETPMELDVSGPATDCTVRKLGDSGTIDVALRTADGQLVATANTYTLHGAVRVRTDGPWGGGSGTRLPTRFTFFRQTPNHPFPPDDSMPTSGNPVPPLGNPTPPVGNPTPALGNPVPPFQQSPVPPP
jgi:hypothetical protein